MHSLGDLSPLWVSFPFTLLQMGPNTQLHCGEVRAHFSDHPHFIQRHHRIPGYSGGSCSLLQTAPQEVLCVTVLLRGAELAREVDPKPFHAMMAGGRYQEPSDALSDWKKNVIGQTA